MYFAGTDGGIPHVSSLFMSVLRSQKANGAPTIPTCDKYVHPPLWPVAIAGAIFLVSSIFITDLKTHVCKRSSTSYTIGHRVGKWKLVKIIPFDTAR